MRRTDELVERVLKCSQVPGAKRRRDIQRELRSHIEDFVDAGREGGHNDDEIERMAIDSFGDPAQIAQAFAWVYRRERAAASARVLLLCILAVTFLMLCAILTVQAGVSIGLGNPVRKVLLSPHTAIEALDIFFTVSTYTSLVALERLFDRNRSWKALGLLALALAILVAVRMTSDVRAASLAFGLVNGAFFRFIQVFVKSGPARTGVVAAALLLFAAIAFPVTTFRLSYALVGTCASWLTAAVAYRHMADAVARMDAALSHRLT